MRVKGLIHRFIFERKLIKVKMSFKSDNGVLFAVEAGF